MSTVSAILDIFPHDCADFYTKHARFVQTLVSIGVTTHQDALSDIYLLYAEHRLTLSELAKKYKVRKIGGVWHAFDPACGHSESLAQLQEKGFDLIDQRTEYEVQPQAQAELPVGVVTSPRELSDKLHVSMRRAQQIFAAQVANLRSGNDLFGMGV
jgi:hypothetical protein